MSNVVTMTGLHSDLRQLWDHQQVAVDQIMDHLDAGRNVVVDAPTGSGKSVIAAHVAARHGGRSIYCADEVALVNQMATSHSSMFRTIVGHTNYCSEPWRCGEQSVECVECGSLVGWFGLHLVRNHAWSYEAAGRASEGIDCPYRTAKLLAAGHPYCTMSTQYWLTDKQYIGVFASRDLILLDECDAILNTADRTFGEDFSYAVNARYGFNRQLSNLTDQSRLLRDAGSLLRDLAEQLRAVESGTNDEETKYKINNHLKRVAHAEQLTTTADVVITTADTGFALRFVDPANHLTKYAWDDGHTPVVALSATPGRAETFARIAGLDPDTVATVHVPHTFPRRNRVVRQLDGPSMSGGGHNDTNKLDALAAEILDVAEGRTLVLVNSRAQAQALGTRLQGRAILHGSGQASKSDALDRLQARPDGILVSQSFWRGVDLVGEACRTVIIAKVPWADFGDPLVRARKDRIPGWYANEAATKLVQGLGRAVRGPDDWARLYILDGGYRQAHGRLRAHYPNWFKEALVLS